MKLEKYKSDYSALVELGAELEKSLRFMTDSKMFYDQVLVQYKSEVEKGNVEGEPKDLAKKFCMSLKSFPETY